jgi:hypothetical protein
VKGDDTDHGLSDVAKLWLRCGVERVEEEEFFRGLNFLLDECGCVCSMISEGMKFVLAQRISCL